MKFEAVIFDLDGTLLDSMDVWEKIDICFLQKRGLPVPADYVTEICARSFEEAAQYTIDLFGLSENRRISSGNGMRWPFMNMPIM